MKSQFNEKEFSAMMYNPMRVPEGENVLKFYKDLSKVREFKLDPGEGVDNNKVMLFIMCMYDKNSPYRKKYSDPLKRKIEIAHDVEFKDIGGGMFESPIEDLLKGKNRVVNNKVVQYVRLHLNFKYAFLVSIEASYYNIMLDIMGGSTSQIKEARAIQMELEETLMAILNQDNNPHLRDAILRYMEDERLELRPEDIAMKLQKGETPISIKEIQ
jgi:hypothetical protein